jgi:DNA primase
MNTRLIIGVRNSASGRYQTLSEDELELCHPVSSNGGQTLRALCPFHGSDHQRSLKVNRETGAFKCFACGEWGYLAESQRRWRANRVLHQNRAPVIKNHPPPRKDLAQVLKDYQAELPGSGGEQYLRLRGIPLNLAQQHGLGFAAAGKWIHRERDWTEGRLVAPHTDPDGNLLNLYGRAVGLKDSVPKEMRHDHLPGGKGYFNAAALHQFQSVYITEGPFDALSLIAAGAESALAVFGVGGWRWDWFRRLPSVVFALDSDSIGQSGWQQIARQLRLTGKSVAVLSPVAYGGFKDPNEAWLAGSLKLL